MGRGRSRSVDVDQFSRRRHELRSEKRVACEPLGRDDEADPAPKSQAADARVDECARWCGEAGGGRRGVEVHESRAGEGERRPPRRIDLGAPPGRQVDQEGPVRSQMPRDAVPTAPDADPAIGIVRPPDGCDDVCRVLWLQDGQEGGRRQSR